jgi:hypothetical protein
MSRGEETKRKRRSCEEKKLKKMSSLLLQILDSAKQTFKGASRPGWKRPQDHMIQPIAAMMDKLTYKDFGLDFDKSIALLEGKEIQSKFHNTRDLTRSDIAAKSQKPLVVRYNFGN